MLVILRRAIVTASASALLLLGACRSYEARPLDSGAHRASWAARSPSSEGVAAFAQRLAIVEGAPIVFDVSDGLSMEEGEAVALFFNTDLRVARLRADVARAGAANAGLWDDPEFGFDAAYILSNVDEPWIAGMTLGITFPISGRLDAEKAAASAEHRAALDQLAADEWATRTRLRREWFGWSAVLQEIDLTRTLLADLDQVVSVADQLEQAGEMARPEARLFRVERLSRQNDLISLEADAREAEIRLREILGLTPEAPVQFVPKLTFSLTAVTDQRDALERRNPTLASLRAAYDVAEKSLAHEIRKQYPDITIGPGIGTEDGDPRVLLGVSLPIPLWNRNQRAVAEAEANREVARAHVESTTEALVSRLAAAEVRAKAAQQQRRELEDIIVPLVDEQFADVERIARAGDFNVLLTLEALVRLHETKTRLIAARLAESLAQSAIEDLIGPRSSSATPPAPAQTEQKP